MAVLHGSEGTIFVPDFFFTFFEVIRTEIFAIQVQTTSHFECCLLLFIVKKLVKIRSEDKSAQRWLSKKVYSW